MLLSCRRTRPAASSPYPSRPPGIKENSMRALCLASLLILFACLAVSRHPTSATAPRAETLRFIYADPAQAQSTGVSGFRGSRREVKEPGSNAFLHGLEFDEKGDKPCFVRAHWWRYTADSLSEDF